MAKQDETPRLWPHNVHLLLIQVNHPMASHRDWFSPHYLRLQEGLLLCWIVVLTTISVAPASPAIVCDFLVFCPNNLVFSIFRLPLRRQKLEDVWSFTLTQAVGNHIIFLTSLWKSFQNQICVKLLLYQRYQIFFLHLETRCGFNVFTTSGFCLGVTEKFNHFTIIFYSACVSCLSDRFFTHLCIVWHPSLFWMLRTVSVFYCGFRCTTSKSYLIPLSFLFCLALDFSVCARWAFSVN